MSTIHHRIRNLIKLKGYNKHSFSKRVGITSQVLQDIVNGRMNKPSFGTFEKILSAFPDVNANWLLTGKEPILYETLPEKKEAYPIQKEKEHLEPPKYGGIKIPLYDIRATAGKSMEFLEMPEYIIANLELSTEFQDCTAAVPIYGDSMYPLLNSGDVMLLKNVSSVEYIKWGHIYLIITENDKLLKFLHTSPRKGYVLFKSYNEKFYEPFEMPKKSILQLYEVKGYIRKVEM